jgi:eukaryotic-like serine/threonine-protein kinase
VMITWAGDVKVMDFGIARAMADSAATMTQTAQVIGTAQYLSPEQARGEAVDARSDVYAAGCVTFELLCGHPPFVGDSPVAVAYQHVREDPRAPSEINTDVNSDVDAIVLKALAKNPLNRYQSAQEMRADLLRAAAGRPVMATPVLRESETVAMGATAITRPINAAGARTATAARVGDPSRRKASAWVLAALSALGVLAVVALIAGLILNNQGSETQAIDVPNVVGQTQAVAENDLKNAGLVPSLGDPFVGECTEGQVAKQSPDAGSSLEEGKTVLIQMCGGPAPVEVPGNLVGRTFDFVEGELKKAGLRVDRKNVDNEAPEGQVVAVLPTEGTSVAKNEVVTVSVSKGNLKVVPDVLELSQEDAEEALANAGFTKINVLDGDEVDPDDAGVVTNQNPNPGQKASTSSTITIVVTQPRDEEPTPAPSTPSPSPSASEESSR